jgi:branched-chain amino acid transport system ATP-binding protein
VTPLLEAESIDAGYVGQAVIRDVNISVGPGEVVAILGANGAGKSTTLRALVGEIPLLRGRVRLKGAPTVAPLHRRARLGVGYLPEDRSVFPNLTVAENLRLGRGGVNVALSYFPELQTHLKRKAGLLSGGQQQMLTLGRILAAAPELLVVDELSQGLAPLLVQRLFAVLKEVAAAGTGVVLVEQYARYAFGLAERCYVMRRGEVVFSGEVDESSMTEERLAELYLGT